MTSRKRASTKSGSTAKAAAKTRVHRASGAPQGKKRSEGKGDSPILLRGLRKIGTVPGGSLDEQLNGVRLTHPEKVLYPEQGITKLALAQYYLCVQDWILPHVVGRPLVLVRCPEGLPKACFFQKHATSGVPKNLRRVPIKETDSVGAYLVADDIGGILSLVQIGVLEIHVWGSQADKLEFPDRITFDLDPDPTVGWRTVIDSAVEIRQFLSELGLASFVKTTGGKGLHVVVPLQRRNDWAEVREFAERVAVAIAQARPERYTTNVSKAVRGGKIFLDYLRNNRGSTAVAAYSTRARAGAPVSTPISWEELKTLKNAAQFNLQNLPARLAKLKRDPWAEMTKTRQSITAGVKKKLRV